MVGNPASVDETAVSGVFSNRFYSLCWIQVSEKTTPLGNTVKRVHGCSTQPGKPGGGNLVDEYTRAAQLVAEVVRV